jgi:hypothetical protein
MSKLSTSGMGKEHEEFVVEIFEWDNAHRSKSSGASYHDPIDVSTDTLVMECECTEADSYRLTKKFWQEIVEKQHSGKLPSLGIRFRDPVSGHHIDLCVLYTEDLSAILKENKGSK